MDCVVCRPRREAAAGSLARRSPQRFWPKKNPPTEERVRNGAHYAKKHVFGKVLEVGADWGEFLEILCTKSGGIAAAAAQSALAPAPAPHNRDQKIIDS